MPSRGLWGIECGVCLVYSRLGLLAGKGGVDEYLRVLARLVSETSSPTRLFVESYKELKRLLGSRDPLWRVKEEYNRLFSDIAGSLDLSGMGLDDMLELMARANSVDIAVPGYSPRHSLDDAVVWRTGRRGIDVPGGGEVVVVLDNAGEALVDLAVAGELAGRGYNVSVIARGGAYEVDVTYEEIEGLLPPGVKGYSTGSSYPAFYNPPPRIAEILGNADLVVSKGIANLEAFIENRPETGTRVLFLLRAKCPRLSRLLGVEQGSPVIVGLEELEEMLEK